ncbi:PadR family transcriptional regulator [Methanocella sp. CWC-04]|uniref:PadR family transcriptional regulator n=1 Tax=Methanooceanicella nereidis TaxID=2052831 RepID=A0AAP2W4Y6_9EURY|nr:PadR family transcriptional regulator [Methanocella sp. CWC-04]MCD1293742.1 PadR family transcriptional regulator [Methanocella sp. CWC-04]
MVDMDLVILGTLLAGPAHGYQLKQKIEGSFGSKYFKISNSSLYPKLTKLESDGFIEGRREPQEKVPDRKVYYVTDAGMKRLQELVATPIKPGSSPGSEEYEFMLHAVYFNLISKEQRSKVITPIYESKKAELKEALEKRENLGPHMPGFPLAVLDNGIEMLKISVRFYETLLEMD